MGYYTGFKYKIKIHEEFEHFFLLLAKGDLEITDFPISYVSPKYLEVWLDYLKRPRNTWLVHGGSAYFEEEDWCTECYFEDDIFYSSGSLKNYENTIEAFVKVLPMFGVEYVLISVGEDWVYDKEDDAIEVYKSENCTLSFDLLEEEK